MIKKLLESLFNLFRTNRDDIYMPKERMIFSYWNGEKLVKADPLTLYRHMADVGPGLDSDIMLATSISKNASKGYAEVVKTIREIFELKTPTNPKFAPDENCLTEEQCFSLLNQFSRYCGLVKKNMSQTLTSATVTSPTSDSSPAGAPATEPTSASTSTAKEASTEKPASSTSESPSPSESSPPATVSSEPSQTAKVQP